MCARAAGQRNKQKCVKVYLFIEFWRRLLRLFIMALSAGEVARIMNGELGLSPTLQVCWPSGGRPRWGRTARARAAPNCIDPPRRRSLPHAPAPPSLLCPRAGAHHQRAGPGEPEEPLEVRGSNSASWQRRPRPLRASAPHLTQTLPRGALPPPRGAPYPPPPRAGCSCLTARTAPWPCALATPRWCVRGHAPLGAAPRPRAAQQIGRAHV